MCVWASVTHMDMVRVPRREAGDVCRCAVVWAARSEVTALHGDVITAVADGVLGKDAGEAVLGDPGQTLIAAYEHPGREVGVGAVKDPHAYKFGIAGTVTHADSLPVRIWNATRFPHPTGLSRVAYSL